MKTQILSTIFITLILFSNQVLPHSDSKVTKPDTTLANQYFAKAEELIQKARYDSSNYYFEKASVIYEKAANQYDVAEVWEKYITCINCIGENLTRLDKFEHAMKYLNKALEIGLKKFGENHPKVADSYNNIGRVYWIKKSDYDRALKYLNKSLAIRLETLGEKHPAVATSYNLIGIIYLNNGDLNQALMYLNKALIIRIQSFGENHLSVASGYNNIAMVHSHKRDYDKMLEYLKKSLTILGENHPKAYAILNNIGLAHEKKGNYDKALQYYNKSLTLSIKTLGKRNRSVALKYKNIANIYSIKGDYNKALEYYNKSLTIVIQTFGENSPYVAEKYEDIGQFYQTIGNFRKAIEYLNKSLTIILITLGEKHPTLSFSYQSLGDLYFSQNNYEKALSYYQNSIISLVPDFNDTCIYSNPMLRNILSENYLLSALESKANTLFRFYVLEPDSIKNIETSFRTYQLATELIDKIRISYKAESSKLLFGERTAQLFDKAIQTTLKLFEITQNIEYKEQAFLFAEKAKSSILLASLQDCKAKQFADIPDTLLEQEKDLKVELTFYETEIQQELQKKDNRDSLKLKEFEAKHFEANTKYEKLMSRLETDYPKYYDLKYQTQAASIPELQRTLDPQSALIEYFVGDSSIFIITVSHDDFDIHTIPKDTAFNVLIESLNESIKQVDSKDYLPRCHQLYNLLIQPIAPKIATKEKLVIIPHGILYKIPFEALIPELPASTERLDLAQVDYLISRCDISYHYSATLYLNSLKQAREYATKNQLADEEFIGFAPVFSDDIKNGYILADNSPTIEVIRAASDLRSITLDGKWFNELLYSKQEVEKILDLFKRRGAVGYFNTDASEENFKQNAKHYKYIHVATHGMINEANPPLSGIIFSQPTDSVYTDDGILYSGETYHLDLNADLVVLSSCESGIGKLVAGEGLMALTRGFLYAGASSLVVSLWKVSDVSTAQLMTEFYRNLKQGMSKAAALRAAKLHLLKQSFETEGIKFSFAHPFFWASFVLIGEPESQMTSKSAYRFLVYVLIIICAVVLVGYLWKRRLRMKNERRRLG